MPSEKQMRQILSLLEITLGFSFLVTTVSAFAALVDLRQFAAVIQQLTKWGKYGALDAVALRLFLLMIAFSIGQILAGVLIWLRRGRPFCLLILAIQWLNWPLGTILSSFGLYYLTRQESIAPKQENAAS